MIRHPDIKMHEPVWLNEKVLGWYADSVGSVPSLDHLCFLEFWSQPLEAAQYYTSLTDK